MSYARFFDCPVFELEESSDLTIDIEHLTVEQKVVVATWLKAQADKAVARTRLRGVLQQALFDVTSAELGGLLNLVGRA
jgi:hypothetical protein